MADNDNLPITGGTDQEAYLSSNIEDYLLSLATSLQDVQRELNRTVIAGTEGTPTVRYQLPKLEFELKMSIEMAKSTSGSTQNRLLARPINAFNSNSTNNAAQAASIIKGMFVAVPVDGGKPPAVVNTSVQQDPDKPNEWDITVEVQSAVGQRLEGIEVQFNIDREESALLSEADELIVTLSPETDLVNGVMYTDTQGQVTNRLEARQTEEAGTYIVVLIDVLGRSESLVFKVGEQATTLLEGSLQLRDHLDSWVPDDDTLYGLTALQDTKDAFVASLPEANQTEIAENPDLLVQLEQELSDKHQELQSKQLVRLSNELRDWLPSWRSFFSNEEAMKQAFISAKAGTSLATLLERPEVWEGETVASQLIERFNSFRTGQGEIIIEGLDQWVREPGSALASTMELREAFITSLDAANPDQEILIELVAHEELWQPEAVSDKLVEVYYQVVVSDAVVDIDNWTITTNQRSTFEEQRGELGDVAALEAVYLSRTAQVPTKVKNLKTNHDRDAMADSRVIAVLQQRIDGLGS